MKKYALTILLFPFSLLNVSFNTGNLQLKEVSKLPDSLAVNLILPETLAEQKYFGDVVDISPNTIVGCFGEPRKSHFHMGLDFRTNAEEGHIIFAAAEGYVSRINVSPTGYGHALYVTHPNGYVTVYGHLKKFRPEIQSRLRTEQYKNQKFSLDFMLPPGELTVQKGDTIAWSGNTGGSGGPHLHFEIRDTFENVYNPMRFGYKLKDDIKPVIGYVKFYPLDDLKHASDGYRARPVLQDGVYSFTADVIQLNDKKVAFSINTSDAMNSTTARLGIYNLTVFDGDKMVYDARFDKLSFPESRYVMSHVDYGIFMNEGKRSFHRCFVEPGNRCGIYSNLWNAGEIDLSDEKLHKLRIEVADYNGNLSQVNLKVKYSATSDLFKKKNIKYTTRFDHDHANEFSNSEFTLSVPENCLFDNLYFNYSSKDTIDAFTYSKIHQAGGTNDFSYGWMTVSVRAPKLPETFFDKAVIVLNGTSSLGGAFQNGFVKTGTRDFGSFSVKIDTTAPKIVPLNIVSGRNMRAQKKVIFKITDNLSGIATYNLYINDKWVLAEYDAKSNTLSHSLDLTMTAGAHKLKLLVGDERKNVAEFKADFLM